MAELKILKLLSGEEIIGDVVETPGRITITRPVRIVVMPSRGDPSKPTVGFAPWAEFSTDKAFVIDRSHIITMMTPLRQFTDQYNTMFNGIVKPTPELIVPR